MSSVQELRETLNRMVNDLYNTPEEVLFYSFPMTVERAKVLAKSHRMLYQPYLRKLLVSALDAEEKTVFRTKRDRPSKGKSGLPRRTTSS